MNISTAANRMVNFGIVALSCGSLVSWALNSDILGSKPTPSASNAPTKFVKAAGKNAVQTEGENKFETTVNQDSMEKNAKSKAKTQSKTPKSWFDKAKDSNDPEFQKWQKYTTASLNDRYYQDAYKILDLDGPTTEALRGLLAEKLIASVKAPEEGASTSIEDIYDRLNSEYGEKISALLGPDKFAQLREYETTLPERNQINQFRSELEFSTEPLTVDQETALLPVIEKYLLDDPIKAAGFQWLVGANPFAAISTIRLSVDDLSMFSNVLTSGQIETLGNMIKRRNNSSSINYPWNNMGNQMRKSKSK